MSAGRWTLKPKGARGVMCEVFDETGKRIAEGYQLECGMLVDAHNASAPAQAQPEQALRKLCDHLDGMKRAMFLRPGTGQHYSYLVHEDVQAYVEQARAALSASPSAPAVQAVSLDAILNCYSPDDTVSDYQDKIRALYTGAAPAEQATTASASGSKCETCDGSGELGIIDSHAVTLGVFGRDTESCYDCNGTGQSAAPLEAHTGAVDATPQCRNQGGICACRAGGSFGGCALDRASQQAPAPTTDEKGSA